MTRPPRVSVVIASYNRAERAERLLRALAVQQGIDGFDVTVVDDASTDDTVARLRALAPELPYPLQVLASERNGGPAVARNRGWRAASGELVAFIDDDVVPEPTWLAKLVGGFDDGDIVVGTIKPPPDQVHLIGPFSHYLDMGHNGRFSTCNIAYRRATLEALDGFDEETFPHGVLNGEDTDLGLRAVAAGCRDVHVADAIGWHDVRPSTFRSAIESVRRLDGIVALVSIRPEARSILDAGWFLSSAHKAVLIAWAALVAVAIPPLWPWSLALLGVAAGLYLWQFPRAHRPPARRIEWLTAVPLGFVYDSASVLVLLRASLRYRTLLL